MEKTAATRVLSGTPYIWGFYPSNTRPWYSGLSLAAPMPSHDLIRIPLLQVFTCINASARSKYGLALLCFFTLALTVSAQSGSIRYLRYTRHNYLATNQVNCIIQDKKKFIWIATSNGIQRFDGNRWRWLSQNKHVPGSLPDNNVDYLLEDNQDRFWVKTSSGICLLNRNNFVFDTVSVRWRDTDKNHEIQSLYSLKDGHTWMVSGEGGLYYFDETIKQFAAADKIIQTDGQTVFQIAYNQRRRCYYLATDDGLLVFDSMSKKRSFPSGEPSPNNLLKLPTARHPVSALHLNERGQLWFTSFNTQTCYDTQNDSVVFCDSSSQIPGVLGYMTDRSGTTWTYGANIAKMNLTTGKMELLQQTPDQLYGINFQNGNYLMEDSEGTYWFATTDGVFIYNRFQQQFEQHNVKQYSDGAEFKHLNVWGFIEMEDSSVVALTTRGEGLYYFDKSLQQLPPKFNLNLYANNKSHVNIRCGVKDVNNHLWVATEKGILLKLYPENGKVEKINDGLFAGSGIYSMAIDKNQNLWIGSFRGTITRRDAISGQYTTIRAQPGKDKSLNNIFSLYYDGSLYLWAATSKTGLLKINTQTNTIEKAFLHDTKDSSSIPSSQIFSVTESSFNQLSLSTSPGLVTMDIEKETFQLLTTADGLPDNNIVSQLKGEKRRLWLASDNGISMVKLDGMKTTSYGILEGLTNESYNVGAAVKLRNGQLLFGHNAGFTSVNPAAYLQDKAPDNARITGLRLFDSYLDVDSILASPYGLILNYSQNFLSIEFSNMSLLTRYHSIYYYQLEGVDEDWKTSNGLPQATYTYLPGGDYTFKVKCVSRSGISSKGITSFRIKIIPPVWKRWWFYLLSLLLLGSIIYLVLRFRYKQKLEVEKGRNRIAKDLHDDMGSTLSTINILSEMAKTKIDTDIPTTKKFIHQISDNSNRIMESLDDIVWNIDKANDSVESIFSRMREFAGNLLEARSIQYTFKEDERLKTINLELGRRHDFFMVFKEAVNNLAKYSDCTSVDIQLYLKKNRLELLIADNGKGFEHNGPFEGNGLNNMQQRAKALNGRLVINSAPDKGTSVALSIPL